MADWDGNGRVTQAEIDQINTVAGGANHAIGETNYNPDMDIDRNGDVQTADYTIANNEGTHSALAKGLISDPSVDNQIGYDSYVFNAETLQYLARNRWYDTVLGRWLQRDPAGYADGMSLYQFLRSTPLVLIDPLGTNVVWNGIRYVVDLYDGEANVSKFFDAASALFKGAHEFQKIYDNLEGLKDDMLDLHTISQYGQTNAAKSEAIGNLAERWSEKMFGDAIKAIAKRVGSAKPGLAGLIADAYINAAKFGHAIGAHMAGQISIIAENRHAEECYCYWISRDDDPIVKGKLPFQDLRKGVIFIPGEKSKAVCMFLPKAGKRRGSMYVRTHRYKGVFEPVARGWSKVDKFGGDDWGF